MPAFDPAKVLDANPAVRIANAYQATLDYAAARLTGGDYASLLVALAAAGLPTDSDAVLTLPNPALFLDGVQVMAMNFVTSGGRAINPTTISSLSPTIAALRVLGNVAVGGNLGVVGSLDVEGELDIATDLLVSGELSVLGDVSATGDAAIGGALGVGQAAPAAGIATPGPVQGDRLLLASGQDPATAAVGTLGEDAAGDLFYKDTNGTVRYIARPQHDTGWINLTNAANYASGGGFLGVNSPSSPTFVAADPSKTPDIHDGSGLWVGSPGVLGDPGAVVRLVIWHLIDANALVIPDPAILAGYNVATPIMHYATSALSGTSQGALVQIREDTGALAITIGEDALVAGFPGTLIFPGGAGVHTTYWATAHIRVMAWIR